MSSVIALESVKFLPVKEAAEFVPYSRDYVARLAREGKVVATQIDRQWFVDVTSLQNFFTNATIEESIRKRHLSSIRKRDLEVRDVYRARFSEIAKKYHTEKRKAVVQSCLILVCGLSAGFLFVAASRVDVVTSLATLSPVPATLVGTAIKAQENRTVTGIEMVAEGTIETDDSFDVSRGIVLLPSASSSAVGVEDFFSDPVTVSMISTTTGSIRNTVSNTAVPFVRVPEGTVVVQGETKVKNSKPVSP